MQRPETLLKSAAKLFAAGCAALIVLSLLPACSGDLPRRDPAPVTVMTFNVLCSFCNIEEFDPWEDRLAYFTDIFRRHDPDLIGLQELFTAAEVGQILDRSPDYASIYFQNDKLLKDYPDATILYRVSRFEVLESGFYWLSPTPDEPWSVGFDKGGQLFRLVAWARLRQKSDGRELYFATTHFDNNPPSQDLSAPLVLERTAPWAQRMPVIVTGDFNSQTYDAAYRVLVEGGEEGAFHFTDAYDLAREHVITTNLDPEPPYDAPGRIDHVFLAGEGWTCDRWTVDLTVYGDDRRYPSDHFAMSAVLGW